MTSIGVINFRGGAESAGSVAYCNNTPEEPVKESKMGFRGSGTESAGSVANKPVPQPDVSSMKAQRSGNGTETAGSVATKPLAQLEKDVVQFRGGGTETAGSVAHTESPKNCPNCGTTINFKGSNNEKETSILGIAVGLAALTAVTVLGLGYAYKKEVFKNLSDGWMKKAAEKIEPAAAKCHEWCASIKKTGLNCWEKIKNIGSSKKD